MNSKRIISALVFACSVIGINSASASVVQIEQSQLNHVLESQNTTNTLLTQILMTLKQGQANSPQGDDKTNCFAGEKTYSQGFVITTPDNTVMRCDMKNGHPQWVNNAIVY